MRMAGAKGAQLSETRCWSLSSHIHYGGKFSSTVAGNPHASGHCQMIKYTTASKPNHEKTPSLSSWPGQRHPLPERMLACHRAASDTGSPAASAGHSPMSETAGLTLEEAAGSAHTPSGTPFRSWTSRFSCRVFAVTHAVTHQHHCQNRCQNRWLEQGSRDSHNQWQPTRRLAPRP